MKLKIIVDFETDKWAVNNGCEQWIPPAIVRTTVADKEE
jgi:hypothetical protein